MFFANRQGFAYRAAGVYRPRCKNFLIMSLYLCRIFSEPARFGRLSELTLNPARAGFCLHPQTASCILRSSKYFRYPETLAPAGGENASEVGVFWDG